MFFLLFFAVKAEKVDSLRTLSQSATGIEKARILNELSEAVVYTNPGESLEAGLQAYRIAEDQNEEAEKYKALKNIGYANGYLGNFAESIKNMEDGLAYYRSMEDSVKIAEALSDIGYLKIALSDFAAGAELYRQALAIREKINDSRGISYSLNNLGALYWEWGKPDDALDYYRRAIPYFRDNKLTEEYASVLGNIGVIFNGKGDHKKALEYYRSALDLNRQIQHNIGIAKIQCNMALIYAEQGEYAKALELFHQSLEIREDIGEKGGIALSLHNMGMMYEKMGQADKAIDYFQKSVSLSDSIGSKNLLLRNLKGLSTVYKKLGNYEKAYDFLEKEKKLNDSIFNAESHRQIEELKTRYETGKKALEIVTLQQENQQQQIKLKKRKVSIFIVLGLAFFAFLSIHLLYVRRKAVLQQKTLLLEQKLLRLQMNPHFIFNSIAAIQSYIFGNSKKDAVNYLSSFSSLMRLILENSATESIHFARELETLRFYLQLQGLRYPRKFDYAIAVDEKIDQESTLIPPMLGQPFIENAIEHGLKNIPEKGKIEIRYILKDETILVEIEDNGTGIHHDGTRNNGDHKSMAIGITKERLELLNQKQKNSLSFDIVDKSELNKGRGTIVRFSIPERKEF